MAKLAGWPALTFLALEKASIRTQSWGVLWAVCGGGDFVELGVGVGLGDVLDGVGVGDVGLDELFAGDEVLDAEGDCEVESVVLGVDEAVMLAERLEENELLGDVLAEADLLVLAEPLGEAEPLLRAELLGDAEADADSLALWLPGASSAVASTAFFGIEEHNG